ncbi:MAG: PH domain-containing protein, partial [Planctomycetaceae bacterium]|nr:PH domain-containing protein [Planctomycetaceae bacterium]
MNYEDKFNDILDTDETIQWIGVPNRMAFMSGGLLVLAVGIFWGVIDLLFVFMFFFGSSPGFRDQMELVFFVILMIAHSFPFWGSILYMIWRYYAHGATFYACTDKRIMIRSGVLGTDFRIFEYDKINDIQININLIEKRYSVGSILFNTAGLTPNFFIPFDIFGWVKNTRFIGIENPYDVFRQIKKLS